MYMRCTCDGVCVCVCVCDVHTVTVCASGRTGQLVPSLTLLTTYGLAAWVLIALLPLLAAPWRGYINVRECTWLPFCPRACVVVVVYIQPSRSPISTRLEPRCGQPHAYSPVSSV
jgi:hypothetical protein